jgi:hypothetical protein
MDSYLQGRLRNTPLPKTHGLLPLFEAVVNSIHAIEEMVLDKASDGEITIQVIRSPQGGLELSNATSKRGLPPIGNVVGFKITDNGSGFHDTSFKSFETLDSDYKAKLGGRGVGRLLWLKAFERVLITSGFTDTDGKPKRRAFSFTATKGVDDKTVSDYPRGVPLQTTVHLDGFHSIYRDRAAKTVRAIAHGLFEHCLWYFVRDGGAPRIRIRDDSESIDIDTVYEEYMYSSASKEAIDVKGQPFELTHVKLKTSSAKQPFIAWCAARREVQQEGISSKVAGLHGKLRDSGGDFVYACYVTSPFLDQHVRPERIGFDIAELPDSLFEASEITLTNIRDAVLLCTSRLLENELGESRSSGRERVERFVGSKAPRYRPILPRISDDRLSVDPDISDRDLELLLHKQLAEFEGVLLVEGHSVMQFATGETPESYRARLEDYLAKADDLKKSDLANYVFHRKVVIDILEKAIQRGADGSYSREDIIHSLIMPMRKTSNEVRMESCNLWLLDESLAFHEFLASDKPLSALPITGSTERREPDIVALNVFDEPILVSDGQRLPLASIVVVEIKRPMRNDASAGEDKDPIEQALGYLDRIRKGGATTSSGRAIPNSEEIPGFCYVICDLTPSVQKRCKILDLLSTSDHQGYFGYNKSFRAYIEVISFDRLLNSARERNRAFFDKLGLPTT